MSTYRCAIDGLLPSEVCEYYRAGSRTCGAPDPDHCPDSLHDEDWRQREGAAEVSEMNETEKLRARVDNLETALHALIALMSDHMAPSLASDMQNMMEQHFEASSSIGAPFRAAFKGE